MRRLYILALLLAPALSQPPTDQQRFAALAKLNESAPPEQRIAYNALIVAFTAFRDDRIATEVCQPAHNCAVDRTTEQARINQEFLDFAEHGPRAALRISAPIAEQMVTRTDADLNSAYEQALAALPESCPPPGIGCVSQTAFRNTQREWIRYRDAWLTYGKLRWPDALPSIWLSNLTEQRTSQIKDFATFKAQ